MRPDAITRQRRALTPGVGGDRVVSQEDAGCLMHTSAGDADPDGTVEAPLRCFSALFCNRGRGWKKIALDTGSSGNQGIHGKKHIFMQKGIHGKKECTYLMI